MKLIKEKKKEILERKIKRKHWETKGIVKSSKIFRLALWKRFNLQHLRKKG